ncbi:MAG: enoyl-CoA hydratase/isomerase family protein [Alphaproteobacteria bacterium]|nr:enoyl-CoA hydratase/isomerase family protein [Alphaproteobacteria bacterium]
MTEFREIRVDKPEPQISRITLARPKQMNAYTTRLCEEVVHAIDAYLRDDTQRVLIITGEGRAFCSGGDVSGADDAHHTLMQSQMSHAREMRDGMHRVILALHHLDKPVIASINGAAVAGGLTLALACDFRIAADSARLGDTSGKFALLPDEGGAWFFPRAMGLDRALKMTLLSEIYDAKTAQDLGLVTEVVPTAELEGRTLEFARAIAAKGPLAVRLAKGMMHRGLTSTLEHSLADAALSVMVSNPTQDVREGVKAFFEKRPPKFEGR